MQVKHINFIEISDRGLIKHKNFIHPVSTFPDGDTSYNLLTKSLEAIDKIQYVEQEGTSGLTLSIRTNRDDDIPGKQEWKH